MKLELSSNDFFSPRHPGTDIAGNKAENSQLQIAMNKRGLTAAAGAELHVASMQLPDAQHLVMSPTMAKNSNAVVLELGGALSVGSPTTSKLATSPRLQPAPPAVGARRSSTGQSSERKSRPMRVAIVPKAVPANGSKSQDWGVIGGKPPGNKTDVPKPRSSENKTVKGTNVNIGGTDKQATERDLSGWSPSATPVYLETDIQQFVE
jgi:hypothetical protein